MARSCLGIVLGLMVFCVLIRSPPLTVRVDSYNKLSIHQKEKDKETIQNQTATAIALQYSACNAAGRVSPEWGHLCSHNFTKVAAKLLLKGNDVHMVQIGAHVGFEGNDPVANGIVKLLQLLSSRVNPNITRKFHWTFVEPAPPNYKRLVQNIDKRKDLCDMQSVNVGIMPDTINNTSNLTFYSFKETIDPETGYDSLSGNRLGKWITQVSGFDIASVEYTRKFFARHGLNVDDYVLHSQVKTKRYSELMKEYLQGHKPLLLMIDTEGFDCNIVSGISSHSRWLPQYLIFETHCDFQPSFDHLKRLGYITYKTPNDAVAIRMDGEL